MWPAYLELHGETSVKEGTVYVKGRNFGTALQRYQPAGQAWRYRGKWTTYCPTRSLSFKNIDRLMPRNDEDFWNIMHEAETAKIQPPTSFADLFMAAHRGRLPRRSIVYPFRLQRFGGWQSVIREHLRNGEYSGRVYHYDINRAYRWAALQGLPDMRTAFWTKNPLEPCAVYLANITSDRIPYDRGSGLRMITSEERDAFRLHENMFPVYGVGFRDTISLAELFH